LLLSNHEEKTLIVKGKPLKISRGQRYTSTLKLADRWRWSVNRVRRFLALLEEQEMITTERTSNGITVTIVNYSIYQDRQTTDETTDKTSNGITDGITDGIQTRIKEVKNDKEVKKYSKAKPVRHKYGQYGNVLLSDQDMEKLKAEFPNDYQERIERVSEYCKSSGKTYSDYLATIRSWARKENKPTNNATNTGSVSSEYGNALQQLIQDSYNNIQISEEDYDRFK
jgi:DNA replication protein DnaD